MGAQAGKVDAILALLAERRRGIVTREELITAGISRRQIAARLASGALIQLFPGVYVVGHLALAPYALEAAALVACRPRALLARRTACGMWKLPVAPENEIDILVVGRHRRSLSGVTVRSIDRLADGELRRVDGLPVTSPSLTLLDVAGDLSRAELTAAIHEARVQRIISDGQLRSTLAAHPNRRGARPLGAFLQTEGSAKVTRSHAERIALRLMRDHGLDPESDVWIGPYRVDFLFRAEKLIVEVDGFRFHATPERFAADRRRTAALMGMGFVVFPLSWSDLNDGAGDAMSRLLAALAGRRH
jgi:very-short-patch-repair endonuclease